MRIQVRPRTKLYYEVWIDGDTRIITNLHTKNEIAAMFNLADSKAVDAIWELMDELVERESLIATRDI
jgi:hypothetical protein